MSEPEICVNDECQAEFEFDDAEDNDLCAECRETHQVCPSCSCAMASYAFLDENGDDFETCEDCRGVSE